MVLNVTFGAVSLIFVYAGVQAQLLATACLASKLTLHNIVRFLTDGAAAVRANLNRKKYTVRHYSWCLSMSQFLIKCE
jgi:hypothetical protein